MKRVTLTIACVLVLGACATSQAHVAVAEPLAMHGDTYAAALAEAFDAYEHEVQAAAALSFASEAEARAVMQTLSEARFDWQLKQALARRGVSMADLARYASSHDAFAREQERTYRGRLARLSDTVDSLVQHVVHVDEHLLAAE